MCAESGQIHFENKNRDFGKNKELNLQKIIHEREVKICRKNWRKRKCADKQINKK